MSKRDGIDDTGELGESIVLGPERLARMARPLEPFGITRIARRLLSDDPERNELLLEFPTAEGKATLRVTPDYGDGPPDVIPSDIANDVLVVIGEAVNAMLRGRRWNLDSARERTFTFGVTDMLDRVGRGKGGATYDAVIDACRRLGKLRLTDQGALKIKGKRGRYEKIYGLFDEVLILDREEAPGGAQITMTLSKALAAWLDEDWRLLESSTYWQLDTPVARRLYRVLDWARYSYDNRGVAELRVPVHFLRDRIRIRGDKTLHIQRTVDSAYDELIAAGYLAPLADGEPRYVGATVADYQRFPTFPGAKAKRTSVLFRFAEAPSTAAAKPRELPAAIQAAKLSAIGVTLKLEPDTLPGRIARVVRATAATGEERTFKASCEQLSWDDFDRVTRTIEVDRKPDDPPKLLAAAWHARANAALGKVKRPAVGER